MRHLTLFGNEPTPHLQTELFRSIKAAMEWGVELRRSDGYNDIHNAYYYGMGYAMNGAANSMPHAPRDTLQGSMFDAPHELEAWCWEHAAMWAKPIFLVAVPDRGAGWVPNRAMIIDWLADRAGQSRQRAILADLNRYKYRQSWRDLPAGEWRAGHNEGGRYRASVSAVARPYAPDLVAWNSLLLDYSFAARVGPIQLGTHVQNLHRLELA